VGNETTPESLGPQLNELFRILNTPIEKRSKRLPGTLAKFPYVNGAIFADTLEPEYFDYAMREALLNACDFDWSKIDVLNYAKLAGLDIETEGNGFAKQQSIPAQRFIKKGDKIKIKFS